MARPSRTGGKISEAKARNAKPAEGRKTTNTKRSVAPPASRAKSGPASDPSKDLKEAREQQAATAEILKVIASSPDDVQPVFDAIAESAKRLIGGFAAGVYRFVDEVVYLATFTSVNPTADEVFRATFPRPIADVEHFRIVHETGAVFAIPDTEDQPDVSLKEVTRARGVRSLLLVPLKSSGTPIGTIAVSRTNPGSFSAHHIELLQTFADQAVIAIENVRLFNETKEALERQTATADILKVIASSPSDVQPVFDTIAEQSNRLLNGLATAVYRLVDDTAHLMAFTPVSPKADAALRALFPAPALQIAWGEAISKGETYFLVDAEVEFAARPSMLEMARMRGWRSSLAVPLMREKRPIGVITVTRVEPGRFDDHHVQLLKTFADQAVIAIENARLFDETQEALERQTATADILKVIASSPDDVQPVFEAIAERSNRLIGGHATAVYRVVDQTVVLAAFTRVNPEADAALRASFPRPLADLRHFEEVVSRGEIVQIADTETAEIPDYVKQLGRVRGFRSYLLVPLAAETGPIGLISVTRAEPGLFAEHDISLLKTFADQAVIAISNVNLFDEVQQRTRDLSEALTYQTGSGNILKVIASSPTDVEPVLETIVENACEVCEAYDAIVVLRDGDDLRPSAHHGPIPLGRDRWPNDRTSISGRSIADGATVHLRDPLSDEGAEFPTAQEMCRRDGVRTQLAVPMLREGEAIGAIVLRRAEVNPFTDKQLAALQTFADQAVIAIGNVRLFEEVQAKTRDLSEALTYQTGSANILRVIASSPTDVAPVLHSIVESACELCEAYDAAVYMKDRDDLKLEAHRGPIPVPAETRRMPLGRGWATGRSVVEKAPVHVRDLRSPEGDGFPDARYHASLAGYRTVLAVPLLREGESIGSIVLRRMEVQPFTDKQIRLLQTFADQAVIAIGNVRLFEEVQAKTRDLTESLEQQTATSEVLEVISASTGELKPVFQKMLENATRVCGANFGTMNLYEAGCYQNVALYNIPDAYAEQSHLPIRPHPKSGLATVARTLQAVQIEDLRTQPPYLEGNPAVVAMSDLAGARTLVIVPMLRENELIGTIAIYRQEVRPFTDKQVDLVANFAKQAVIAIENTRLLKELRERTDDLSVSLQQQTATADVLKVISRSAFDLEAVLNTLVRSAVTLSGARTGTIFQKRGELYHLTAEYGYAPGTMAYGRANPIPPGIGSNVGRTAMTGSIVQMPDVLADPDFTSHGYQRLGNFRAMLGVPLKRDGKVEGVFSLTKPDPGPFEPRHVELVQTFADQAVIAIENVRLFDEVQTKTRDLTEALTYQTGSSSILSVIASSPTEIEPVLKAIAESACDLCDAYDATVFLKDGNDLRICAHRGPIPIDLEKWPINRNWVVGRSVVDRLPVHVSDFLSAEGANFPEGQEMSRRQGHRCVLSVPLLSEGESVGAIAVRRLEANPFADKQIALLQTFANQAVIAIGNVRLFREVQAKTRDLTESLEQQTATSEVLGAISSSLEELDPLFQKILENAVRVCGAKFGTMNLYDGERFTFVAGHNVPREYAETQLNKPFVPHPRGGLGTVAATHRAVHIEDMRTQEPYLEGNAAVVAISDLAGARTIAIVPMLNDHNLVGTLAIYRQEVRPFTEKQITLLGNFAKQAVIAIENHRLLKELRELLQQQTATAEALKVISRSAFDLPTVLQTLIESAARQCDADQATVTRQKSSAFYRGEFYGFSQEFIDFVRDVPVEPGRGNAIGRTLLEGVIVHIPDVMMDPDYTFAEAQRIGEFRTMLCVPMMRDGVAIGVFTLTRSEVRPFTDKQIDLVTTFADQAAIAIENVRLFDEVQARTRELSRSLEELHAAQGRLVQTEKLASLGQLTAGIAHEIKNPLNFVNNFAALSVELIDELGELLKPASLDDKTRRESDELAQMLKGNLEKVVQHGKRADSIVKNMLLHSREGSGEHRLADINVLVDESLNLAYHGARAEKPSFNVTMQRSFDPAVGTVDVYPQEITRVLLNLISNGFYAAAKRKTDAGDGFEPTLTATTKNLGDNIEIRIRDNGTGIPDEVKVKIFNPFFTTKPAGEGTGLGLSMSHDIIVKQHGGKIDLETEPGQFTEFRIVLPRTNNLTNKI